MSSETVDEAEDEVEDEVEDEAEDEAETVDEAKVRLAENMDEGMECPVCEQYVKAYKRKIHSTMARALITLWRHGERPEFTHVPSLPGDTHELSQFAWWGFVEEERTRRPDGGRAGFWRITEAGEQFVLGQIHAPKHAVVYNGSLLELDDTEQVSIHDALGKRFRYDELMGYTHEQ